MNTAESLKDKKYKPKSNTARGAIDVANTIRSFQDPSSTGAQRLSNIISTIMSFGGEAGKDSIQGK